ncbi:PTS glucose transporter subunit IIA [Oceanobacillus caeni]
MGNNSFIKKGFFQTKCTSFNISNTFHIIGIELLIHVGLETVELNGEPFTVHVEDGQRVHQGDKLITFDKEMIREKGLAAITPVIITNMTQYQEVIEEGKDEIKTGDKLFNIVK